MDGGRIGGKIEQIAKLDVNTEGERGGASGTWVANSTIQVYASFLNGKPFRLPCTSLNISAVGQPHLPGDNFY